MALHFGALLQELDVHVHLMLGPAGSGKTSRCLGEIHECLSRSPEGPPLVLLAPNQTTYQLERQLLAKPGLSGYTRLHILSFERLARQLFAWLHRPCAELLDEEGRVMVLRALLARKREDLKLFRASSRLTGFAQQLSNVLREFQQNQFTPELLNELALRVAGEPSLSCKLQDLAALLQEYNTWLGLRGLQDADCLLSNTVRLLSGVEKGSAGQDLLIERLWVDGFAEFTLEELDLLGALLPSCGAATLTFCLEAIPAQKRSWLSTWSVPGRAFEACRKRLAQVPGTTVAIELLPRHPDLNRFRNNPVLRHLERHWSNPDPPPAETSPEELSRSLRLASCPDSAGEVIQAAREILAYVRSGGRYREVTVLVRDLEDYYSECQRLFTRYGIPFFLDRRESMAHHPVAELTRSALRTIALGWQHDDWFAALKTGLVPATDEDVDRLENEALARGWRGGAWQQPLRLRQTGLSPEQDRRLQVLETELDGLRVRLVAPFQKLALAFKLADNKPTGKQVATALRGFWELLEIDTRLDQGLDRRVVADAATLASPQETAWNQINSWVDNIELAFADEAMPLREWLPILEAGLSNLTVGVIPPALDQVFIGAMDRSRNPDIKLAILLGMNEGVFPAIPSPGGLLTEADLLELEKQNALPTSSARQQLARERLYAYIACTRPRKRLALTCAARDSQGRPSNPSPFLGHIQRLFPTLTIESAPPALACEESLHLNDLVEALVAAQSPACGPERLQFLASFFSAIPIDIGSMGAALERLQAAASQYKAPSLSPALAAQLYGPVLRTSVSRIEQFATCPFKFFVHSGLRAQERKRFELDSREQGSFQHDVLAIFHTQLVQENRRWRDITPQEARTRVAGIAQALMASYREGLLQATEQTRFMARVLTDSLQDFVQVLLGWMRQQYQFDPVAVELPFGPDEASPGWSIDLQDGHQLQLYGRIDRVDLAFTTGRKEAICVVVDYKSSHKQLDPVLMAHGLQLQLMAYLNVLRHWPGPAEVFGASRLIPAGVFYVNLRGRSAHEQTRAQALEDPQRRLKLAYRHAGRFDAAYLRKLDSRSEAQQGDQFNYRLTSKGELHKGCREPVPSSEFVAMLDLVETNLRGMGRRIYQGSAEVDPFRKGSLLACRFCEYQAVCRIDPWTHHYRVLKSDPKESP